MVAGSKDIVFCANRHSLLSPAYSIRAQGVGWCHPHSGSSLLGISFWDWPHRHTRDELYWCSRSIQFSSEQSHVVMEFSIQLVSASTGTSFTPCHTVGTHKATGILSGSAKIRRVSQEAARRMEPARVFLQSLYLFVFYKPAMCWTQKGLSIALDVLDP